MKNDNLKRIRGVLSAKKGAEIPKFGNGAKFRADLNETTLYSEDGAAWYTDLTLTTPYSDLSPEDLTYLQNNKLPLLEIVGGNSDEGNPTASVEQAAKVVTIANTDNDISEAKQRRQERKADRTVVLESGLTKNQTDRITRIRENGNAARADRVEARVKARNEDKAEFTNAEAQQAADISAGAINAVGNAFKANNAANNSDATNAIDSGVGAISSTMSSMGGVAGVIGDIIGIADSAGQIIRGITGGTDLMTGADKFFDSGIGTILGGFINLLGAQKSDAFATDVAALEAVGSSYGGTAADISEAAKNADKKYGLFSSKARRKANEFAKKVAATQNIMSDVANTATDQRLAVQSMGEQAGLAYSMMADGGYNLKYTYAAKHGGLLEWNPVVELEWEPQVELNWELPTFKKGGSIEFVEELEWIPEFKSGNKIRTIEELIEYAKQQNPRFIQRLSEEPRGIKFTDDGGKEAEGSHYLESRGEYVIPRIQEVNGELQFFNSQDALNRALETGNYLKLSPEEAIIFAEQYKQGWPDFFKKFKNGGSVGDSDIPETEETTQKNVIPEGALHKNKHHMEHAEGLTKKGIPVIDEDGEQQAEIEHSEIIFTLEVTKKLEEYYEIFYSEESTNKEKEQAALDAGKLLVYQILENTEDRTGLIESCKKGGSLTLKKSTDDLIEEVLEWMPTIVVVETEEPEESKEDKPRKKLVDDSKEELKLMIKLVLVEMLIK